MATWRKVIVSGSTANLANIQVDSLSSGVVIGAAGNLSTTAINGTGNIVATTGATGLVHSGSFSGSFKGDGSNLSGVLATPIFPSTQVNNITSVDKFFISQSSNQYITYGDLLTDLAGTNLAVEGSDSLTLAATITSLTSVTSTGFTGSLLGTAATASFVTTAQTASYVLNAVSSSFASTAPAGNLTGNTLASGVTNSSLTSLGTISSLTATNAIITGNLTVQGTASFQNTSNLEVADRFVLFASGSTSATDGGIVVQQGTQNVGELYGYDSDTKRWAFTSSFLANQTVFTPAAYITTTEFANTTPPLFPTYGSSSFGFGNIYVNTGTGDIFIYA